jgi:hypothetical protein
LLERLAGELSKLPNDVLIEGRTDAKPFASDDSYSNWELSTDRANSARNLMQASGLPPEQVAQVRGYADRQLRHPEDPTAASNRRISVIVQYVHASGGAGKGERRREDGRVRESQGGRVGGALRALLLAATKRLSRTRRNIDRRPPWKQRSDRAADTGGKTAGNTGELFPAASVQSGEVQRHGNVTRKYHS